MAPIHCNFLSPTKNETEKIGHVFQEGRNKKKKLDFGEMGGEKGRYTTVKARLGSKYVAKHVM